MKIVIAPDSFKGSLTAAEVCASVRIGVRRVLPEAEVVCVPMADGGEGLLEALIGQGRDAEGGVPYNNGCVMPYLTECEVEDPLGRPVKAVYGITDGGTAVIEMAQASGLTLLAEHERNPLKTSTYGTGQLIKDALDRGVREFIIGIGGSATNDGGAGMARALGYVFFDESNDEGNGGMARAASPTKERVCTNDVDSRIKESRFVVACDVDNPLCGVNGASAVFGPQKGATPEMVEVLDKRLAKLAECMERDLGKDVKHVPGAGAAGGLGAGCLAFLGAELRRGVDIVIEATGLADKIKGASLVITGEGRTDMQTLAGKTAFGVAKLAQRLGVPVVLISGSLADGAEEMLKYGVDRMYALMEGNVGLEEAMRDGIALLGDRAEQAVREIISFDR